VNPKLALGPCAGALTTCSYSPSRSLFSTVHQSALLRYLLAQLSHFIHMSVVHIVGLTRRCQAPLFKSPKSDDDSQTGCASDQTLPADSLRVLPSRDHGEVLKRFTAILRDLDPLAQEVQRLLVESVVHNLTREVMPNNSEMASRLRGLSEVITCLHVLRKRCVLPTPLAVTALFQLSFSPESYLLQ
jgi:hypothetical protein